jgi:hypothetical protein
MPLQIKPQKILKNSAKNLQKILKKPSINAKFTDKNPQKTLKNLANP